MVIDVIVAVLGAAALLGRAGFCLYAAGLVLSKNSAGMVARLLCDLCLVTLIFWIVGAAILFQTTNAYFSLNPKFLAAKIVNGQGIESIVFFIRRANFWAKYRTNEGMSSRRSRSAGIVNGNTLRR